MVNFSIFYLHSVSGTRRFEQPTEVIVRLNTVTVRTEVVKKTDKRSKNPGLSFNHVVPTEELKPCRFYHRNLYNQKTTQSRHKEFLSKTFYGSWLRKSIRLLESRRLRDTRSTKILWILSESQELF